MTFIILGLAGAGLLISLIKSRGKTKDSLVFGFSMLKGMALQIVSILALVALFLALVPQPVIVRVLGGDRNVLSTLWGALLGTVTIIPGIIAFPLSSELVRSGASLVAISAFITTLTMVGFATMPLEIEHFGKRFTLIRNGISFLFALVIALLMGVLL